MTDLRATLTRAIADVASLGRPWALVGGLAVSARAEPRPTRDVDIAMAVDGDEEAETVARDLVSRGYELVAALEQTTTKRLATIRLRPIIGPEFGALIDLLFASSGIEAEITQRAELMEILPGFVVPVASVPDLIALKVLARDDRNRPQDYDDLRALTRAADPALLRDARAALRLIASRGYGRERDLVSLFDSFLEDVQGRP